MIATVALSQLTWYVTRSSGLVAFALITAAVVLGVLGAERFETSSRPRIHFAELHRGIALFGSALLLVHIITAVLDPFTHLGLTSLFDPFGRTYRPLYLGLGIAAFDVMLAVVITSLLRHRMSPRAWKALHLTVYPIWVAGIIHGLGTGTDSHFLPIEVFYVAALGAVVIASWIRVLSGNPRSPLARTGAGALALFVPGLLVAWALSGPMTQTWSKRFVTTPTTAPVVSPQALSSTPTTTAATTPTTAPATHHGDGSGLGDGGSGE
ncbi:MAG: ferric reductase-like transmembrane domain-containing protein [Acidimicrobiales bacterium]